jgi:hypothetical protein
VAIQIDVHFVGEIWYTRHVRAHDGPYVAIFRADSTELDGFYCYREKGLMPRSPARLTYPLVPPNFSLLRVIKAVDLSQSSVDEQATSVYWAHISSMWYVQNFLVGANYVSILNRQTGAITLEVTACHITFSALPNRWCLSTLHFLLVVLSGLQQAHVITNLSSRCVVVTYSSRVASIPLWLLSSTVTTSSIC